MNRILIADEHYIIREGLKTILTEAGEAESMTEASNAAEVFEILKQEPVDLLLLDSSLPDKKGIELLTEIKAQYPELTVILMSYRPEAQLCVHALRTGASGYLSKNFSRDELLKAIHKAMEGRKYVSNTMAQLLTDSTSRKPHDKLSPREYGIMCSLAAGQKVKEIAGNLYLSISTVNTYKSRLMRKMSLRSEAEIIRYALKNGLVE